MDRKPKAIKAIRLLKRLSRERHGFRDLTADIYEFLGHEVIRTPRTPHGVSFRYFKNSRWVVMRDFTESSDEAMRLAREHGANSVKLYALYPRRGNPIVRATVEISTPEQYDGTAATPALAICIGVVKSILGLEGVDAF